MNKIQLIGRLTADPELKTTNNGINVCTFTVAVSRRFNRDETDFFPVSVWREAGVNCNKYLAKGSQVGIAGSIQFRRYEDNEGVKRTAVDVQADEVEFLSRKEETQAPPKSEKAKQATVEEYEFDDDDELPF